MIRRALFPVIVSMTVGALLPRTASAAEIEWRTDAAAAWEEATADGRPLLIFVTMPGCHYCAEMERRTFADADVAAEVEAGFVPLLLDSQENARYVQRLRVRSFPTILIASPPRGTMLAQSRGFQSPAAFKKLLESAHERGQALARSGR